MSIHDDLIDHLVARHHAVAPNQLMRSIGVAAVIGAVLILPLVAFLGVRADLAQASGGMIFWTKIAYGGVLAMTALAAVAILARPETNPPAWLKLVAIPVVLLMILAGLETSSAAPDSLRQIWLGKTALVCPALILALSLPSTVALMFAVRRGAPTRLRATGAVIGLASGGLATTLYALHCPESGYGFVLAWYSLGILLAVTFGGIIGPRALRW